MLIKQDKNKARQKRHLRVRNHIAGTAARPRLNVFRSLKNIYAQIIDDEKGVTLVSASSKDKDFSQYGGNVRPQRPSAPLLRRRLLKRASLRSSLTAAVTSIMAASLLSLRQHARPV